MKRFSFLSVCVACGLSLLILGCAKEPIQELSAAKTAIASAKAAQADIYVAEEFSAVQDSLKAAEAEIAKQKSASALSRNYDKAKATLASVMSMAAPLNAKAVEEKAKAQSEADAAIGKLASSIAEAKELIKKVPKGKEAKVLFDAKGKDIADVDASAADIQNLKSTGDFKGAIEKANTDIAKIDSIKAELSAANEKASKPKSKKKK